MGECQAKPITFLQAVDKIARKEQLNVHTEYYLNTYDIALHVVFGSDLYAGANACAERAKEIIASKPIGPANIVKSVGLDELLWGRWL